MKTGLKEALLAAVLALSAACWVGCGGDDGGDNSGSNTGSNTGGDNNGGNNTVSNNTCTSAGSCKSKKMPDGKTWMTENLNIETASGSYCYDNSPDSCAKYGRLYTWVAAMSLPDNCATKSCASQISSKHRGICPSGWHLPSRQEWQALVDSVGGSSVAGKKLKSKTGWNYYGDSYIGTDEYGFSALPGGIRDSDGFFNYAGLNGSWWTATETDAYNAYGRYMYYYNDNVYEYSSYRDKSDAFSARCVEDERQ